MSVDAPPIAEALSDLPPRTWRGWWLERPKWLRIGMLAVLIVMILQLGIAARIAVGLVEDQEISSLRGIGGEVVYPWHEQGERFPGYLRLMDGLMGRSVNNVYAIVLPDEIVGDVNQYATQFPHLKVVLVIPHPPYSRYLGRYQNDCHGLVKSRRNVAEPVVIRSAH